MLWVFWVNQWFKFNQTWVILIGFSGCHARDTNISTDNPVVKVSAGHTALDLDPTNNKLKSELASKVMWSYHSDLSDSGVVLDEAVDALYLKKENLVRILE